MASASEHSAWRRLVSQLLRLPVNQFSNTLASDPRIKAKFKTITSKLQSTQITGNDPTIDSDVLKYTWPALKLALTVFEGILDGVPIPGLKGAIGGFLELVKAAEVSARVTNWATCTVAHRCPGIGPETCRESHSHFKMLVWSKRAPSRARNSYNNLFPVSAYLYVFTQPDQCLRSLSDLAEFSQEFHKLTARGTLHCFLSATDDAAKLSGLIHDIDQLVNLPGINAFS
jgi:hypothetical protein